MNYLKRVIKLLAQGLDLSKEDVEDFEFDFEQLEEPSAFQQMTEEEWEKFRQFQEDPPQTEEEKREYQELQEKAQQAVAARKKSVKLEDVIAQLKEYETPKVDTYEKVEEVNYSPEVIADIERIIKNNPKLRGMSVEKFPTTDTNWTTIAKYPDTSLDFLREFAPHLNWKLVHRYHRKLPESFLREMGDYVNWTSVSQYEDFSEDFIREHQDKLDWSALTRRNAWNWKNPSFLEFTLEFFTEFADKIYWPKVYPTHPNVPKELRGLHREEFDRSYGVGTYDLHREELN